MAITLFTGKNFKRRSHRVRKSHGDLTVTDVDHRTKSLRSSSRNDRALFFSKTGYRGKVGFMSGRRDVKDFSEHFFGKLRAIRIDPFELHLNVTVVHKGDNYPGSWGSRSDAKTSIEAMVDVANRIWAKGLLRFRRKGSVHFRESLKKFNLRPPFTKIPAAWKRRGLVDLVIVDSIGSGHVAGTGKPPALGNTVVIPRRMGLHKPDIPDREMGYALAHEVGHYLGIHHGSTRREQNLMFRMLPGSFVPEEVEIRGSQIEKVHRVLAKNLTRKGDRH